MPPLLKRLESCTCRSDGADVAGVRELRNGYPEFHRRIPLKVRAGRVGIEVNSDSEVEAVSKFP